MGSARRFGADKIDMSYSFSAYPTRLVELRTALDYHEGNGR